MIYSIDFIGLRGQLLLNIEKLRNSEQVQSGHYQMIQITLLETSVREMRI